MGFVYLAALIMGLGVLAVQITLGIRGGDHPGDLDAGDDGGADEHGHAGTPGNGVFTALLSIRFWVFFGLGFGLSGSLMHYLDLANAVAVVVIAAFAGIASGLFAAYAFRAVARAATSTQARASQAVGAIGKVLVGCDRGSLAQIRVQLGGSHVDFMATTDEDALARGEFVLVEQMRGAIAHVSRRPSVLE